MSKNYIPPKQGMFGQIFDTILVLLLVYASLMVPLLFKAEAKADAAAATAAAAVSATWESLGQNAIQQAQWVKLGYDPNKAAELINSRFDYTIDPMMLIITILVVAGYFIFMLKVSDKEYREVIKEKFDNK
jgi:flagellar basal body-associated protein FliL